MAGIENLTIMLTDIVGFSRMVSSMSRKESETLLTQHNKLLKKIIKQFRGQHIKSIGDSFLVVFRSPTDAVLCSMAIQDCFWERNQNLEQTQAITIRIALNSGEVRLAGRDVFGEAVNIASRLESETPGGEIYLTESVYLAMNKNEVALEALGGFTFKGIPEPISVYSARRRSLTETFQAFPHYPFGGAHYQLKPASKSAFVMGRIFVGLSTALIVAFCTWWATITYMPSPDTIEMEKVPVSYVSAQPEKLIIHSTTTTEALDFLPDITEEIRLRAEPLLQKKNYLGLKTLTKEYEEEYPYNAYLYMLRGHGAFYSKAYREAIHQYEKALKADALLSSEKLLSKNLVKLLDYERIPANKLLGAYMSEPIVQALANRTGKPGLRARYDAFYLLKDSGNSGAVDRVGLNIWDLRELKECRLKHVAVKELLRIGDARALPALKEVVNVGIWQRLKYTCLRKDAKQAIVTIEQKPNPKQG